MFKRMKRKRQWIRRLLMSAVSLTVVLNLAAPAVSAEDGGDVSGGATYFTDSDNWGGPGSAGADGDLDIGIKNQNKTAADNYDKFPVEFKFTVDKPIPADASAYILIRGYDVDEEDGNYSNGDGEWDRVYLSSDPNDIQLGAPYTAWPANSDWSSTVSGSGIPDSGYLNEMNKDAYLGALSGNDSEWNTTVLPVDIGRLVTGDNYVGVTIHHYFQDTSNPNSNWQMTLDWGQLVIDGGERASGEITSAGLSVGNGSVTVDPEFLAKLPGDYAMEINVIGEADNGGDVVEQNLVAGQVYFPGAAEGSTVTMADAHTDGSHPNFTIDGGGIHLLNGSIDPSKAYKVNIVLFDNRSDGGFDPGKAEHIYSLSTFDPVVSDIAKTGPQYEPTPFAADDFTSKYNKLNGTAADLRKVQIKSLPDQGRLVLNEGAGTPGEVGPNQEIPLADLPYLQFEPDAGGLTGSTSFQWNGFDGEKYALLDAGVTIAANAAPVVDNLTKPLNKGESLTFGTGDFTGTKYADPETAPLQKVKIVSLPDGGKLVYDGTEVIAGQEIPAGNLGQLEFIPEVGRTGPVTFGWNGSDGLQYAKEHKTVTVAINTPPVLGDIRKAGLSGAVISFGTNDFGSPPAYIDADSDPLHQVTVTLPSDFASSGTLWYTTVTDTVYLNPGASYDLSAADLESLTFMPSESLPNGSEVTIPWLGNDGKQDAEAPASVIIAYNGIPVAEPQAVSAEEGAAQMTIVLGGSDRETITGLVYGVKSDPAKGTLMPADPAHPDGNTWMYTPNPDFTGGEDVFTFSVTDGDGQESAAAPVTIRINKSLDGWAGGKDQGDPTVVKAIPGESLLLTAVSSLLAEEVTANIGGTPVPLTLVNAETASGDGFKRWKKTNYLLPAGTAPGTYAVTFEASTDEHNLLPAEPESRLGDNKFEVVGAGLALTANPAQIVGNGKSTTELTAVLTDADGSPIPGVEVEFSAPSGTFVGSNKAVTNEHGKAVVTYKSAVITGIDKQRIPVTAKVHDPAKGLSAQDEIEVTFLPALIQGVITKGGKNEPVAGATVRVTLDLDGNGTIEPGVDFDQTVVTDVNGAYSLPVPKGDAEYDLQVTQTVLIGGVETPVTFNQKARVGEVTGSGDESFQSEKTVTGIVLFKKPDGQTSLIHNGLLSKTKVYLKDADGHYISENGAPKAFDLRENGLFNTSGLEVGDYELEIRYEIGPGEEITISRSSVSVQENGEMNISQELIDPYGTITDAVTGSVIEGAKVTLYYADTQRNRDNGRTPGEGVVLPALAGFEPNGNASPEQLSDEHGFYAYMVFPNADYYLVVTKDGYATYKSPVLKVGTDIVKHDLALTPISNGPVFIPPAAEVALNLSVDNNQAQEGTQSTIAVDYGNPSTSLSVSGEVSVTLPEGVEIVDADGGAVDGSTVKWPVENLAAGGKGSFTLVVKWPMLDKDEASYDVTGEFAANGSSAKAQSSLKIQVFSGGKNLQHQRYILGYPDGLFKPDRSLTRAELAAIVARLTDNSVHPEPLSYSDVPAGYWAANYIKIATKQGFFGGFEDGTFRPDEAVTRGELASVMARFLKLQAGPPAEPHFADVKGYWGAAAIEQLYGSKFVSGYPDGTFKPRNPIIRSEAVTLINRMLFRGPLLGLDPMFPDVGKSHWAFGDVQEATSSHESIRNSDGSEAWTSNLEDDVK